MSNRSLIEINHDFSHVIRRDPNGFIADLHAYLSSGSPRTAEMLSHYGIRVFGMRHHSEAFEVKWGTHATPISEEASRS